MEKLAAWLLTETGKKAVYVSACVGTTGCLLLKCLPNTFLIEQYKDFVHLYEYVRKYSFIIYFILCNVTHDFQAWNEETFVC